LLGFFLAALVFFLGGLFLLGLSSLGIPMLTEPLDSVDDGVGVQLTLDLVDDLIP
jgi:hypothetical protein